ncbi:MAG: c-type cytochrome [Betaproteobacteria bacterium]|nr:c-type cytochrome [Betaproteobacteria bacterium]
MKFPKKPVLGTAIAASLAVASLNATGEDAPRPVNPYAGNAQVAVEGGSLFNQFCSHCHGPWAEQGERPRDLRRLNLRYGDDAIAMFYTTVSNGRMDKGMPVWKGVLPDDTLWKIFTFLMTVQSEE